MVSAFIYIRFSTPKQEAGSSKDRQIEDCRAYLDRQGWDEAEVIEDLGISAWKGNHLRTGNLGKFAQRVIDGEIPRGSVLVVQNLDRLSRQEPRKTQRWMEDMWDAGLRIASVRDGKVYDAENLSKNIMDIFDVLYKAKAANDYVEVLSSRVKRSYDKRLEQARLDGTPIGNKTPAWIRTVGMRPDLRFELIPERMVSVWEIFKLTIDGKPLKIKKPADAKRLGIGLVPEDRKLQGLVLRFSVQSNIVMASLDNMTKFGFVDSSKEKGIAERQISNLGVKTPSAQTSVVSLSGGNQQKCVVGRWLEINPQILIMDEPTRGIDVGAKYEIYVLMKQVVENGGSIIMISSELPEVLNMSNRVLTICEGRITGEFNPETVSAQTIMDSAIG